MKEKKICENGNKGLSQNSIFKDSYFCLNSKRKFGSIYSLLLSVRLGANLRAKPLTTALKLFADNKGQ